MIERESSQVFYWRSRDSRNNLKVWEKSSWNFFRPWVTLQGIRVKTHISWNFSLLFCKHVYPSSGERSMAKMFKFNSWFLVKKVYFFLKRKNYKKFLFNFRYYWFTDYLCQFYFKNLSSQSCYIYFGLSTSIFFWKIVRSKCVYITSFLCTYIFKGSQCYYVWQWFTTTYIYLWI